MRQEKWMPIVKDLLACGKDFKRDAYELSSAELTYYSELARRYGYKKPVLHSRGFGFYTMLRRIYNNMSNK